MAKLYNNFASDTLMSFGKSFSRLNGQPLDKSEVWFSFEDAQAYARTDAAYVSQKISVVDTTAGAVTHYSIENKAGDLKELGSGGVLIVTFTGSYQNGTAKASHNALEIHNYVKKGGCVLLETMPGADWSYASYSGSIGYEGHPNSEKDDLIIATFTARTKGYCVDVYTITASGELFRREEEYVGRIDPVNGGPVFNNYENNKAVNTAAAFGNYTDKSGADELTNSAGKFYVVSDTCSLATSKGATNCVVATKEVVESETGKEVELVFNGGYVVKEDIRYNEAYGEGAIASGLGAVAYSRASKSLGYRTQTGYAPNQELLGKRPETSTYGTNPENKGQAAVALGSDTIAVGNNSLAGGHKSVASGNMSLAFGANATTASGSYAIALGDGVTASGTSAAALGKQVKATAKGAIAIGTSTEATNTDAFALGTNAKASGQYAVALGHNVVACGLNTVAIGLEAVTSSATEGQVVLGKYNTPLADAAFIVGNGTDTTPSGRNNALVINTAGNATFSGDVYANGGVLLATKAFVNQGFISRKEFETFVSNINTALAQITAAQAGSTEN